MLKIKTENISEALSSLHSILYIPEDTSLPILTFHGSFTDFITTEERSGEHFLEPSKSHQMLGLHCLGLLQSSLMENIGQLEGLLRLSNTVSSSVKDQIPEVVVYACINWASHMVNINARGEVEREVWDELYSFFDEKLLQWFECLSLLNRLGDAITSLQKLEAWVPVCAFSIFMKILMAEQQMKGEHNLQNAIVDARQFIIEKFDLVSYHPGNSNSSAIVLLPEQSHIWMKYGDKRKSEWKGLWGDACEQVLWGHSDKVFSVVFSPDGSHVVSGSNDNTVHIWNVVTGEAEAVLMGHSSSVYSVDFSPDSSHVVSGSADNTIHIWNMMTGESEAELKGDSGEVYSVAFSPDGKYVVSGLFDHTIQIWNVMMGVSKVELKGHLGGVYSVAFSPDGSHVASGSIDNTVHIWNVERSKLEAKLMRHSGSVNSVIFSPDGRHVASGSIDNTACIWNVETRELEAVLMGHLGSVNSVAFSPDGSHVVSGSADNTIRIWNVATGKSEIEHSGHVNSVVFSPDGSCVVSGSNDNTVRIWNVVMGESEVTHREPPASSMTFI